MNVLITGANGFAGSHLTDFLLSQDMEVVALAGEESGLSNLKHLLGKIRVEHADLRDSERITSILRDTRPERVYHLAALSSPALSLKFPKLTFEVNFGGTLNLLCAVRELQLDCRLLYVGSAEIYGSTRQQPMPLREDAPMRPTSPYAASKAASELLAYQFFEGYSIPIVRARPFHHTGPRQSANFVCSSFARQVAEIRLGLREPVVSVGNLNVRRDFTDVRDIVRGYYLLLEKGQPGSVYQLCSGRAVSIEAILQILVAQSSRAIQVQIDRSKLRPLETSALWGSAAEANSASGWEPRYELETTLRDLECYWESELLTQASLQ
jgi:GDP-4-dehydro-6-deoxy-D-mannose reductase